VEVLHCTNLFPFLTPSVYGVVRRRDVAVVQSVRNYRLSCVNALHLRGGEACESCLGRGIPWSGIRHGCYRGSRAASAAVALQTAWQRWLGISRRAVDWYFTPSEFARRLLIRAQLPEERLSVKPNFLPVDPGAGPGTGGYAAFAGRLSEEKGLNTLLDAWMRHPGAPELRIIGDGPLADVVGRHASGDQRIKLLGRLSHADLLRQLRDAMCLVMPSVWYETFGRTVMESLAVGTPVLASRLGAMAELVEDQSTGILFEPGDAIALAGAMERFQAMPADRRAAMRRAARQAFLDRFTSEGNYEQLMTIYRSAAAVAASRVRRRLKRDCRS
jgi:glycosyltransferase involved in cell wall biosynthesis